MHGRLSKADENSTVDSLEMPVSTATGGRTRRTGLLTVMERPPGMKLPNPSYFVIASGMFACKKIDSPKHLNITTSIYHSSVAMIDFIHCFSIL